MMTKTGSSRDRDSLVGARVTGAEKSMMALAADLRGQSLSAFLREAVLDAARDRIRGVVVTCGAEP